MDAIPIKIGGKAQADNKRINLILERICRLAEAGYKVIAMPSARGSRTDELLETARQEDINSGRELAHYLVHNGEELAGYGMCRALKDMGIKAELVRPEDDAFPIYGSFSDSWNDFDKKNMEFADDADYLNCCVDLEKSLENFEAFERKLYENHVVVLTAWALKANTHIGLIKGRGGSDGSLVAVSELLERAGIEAVPGIKVTDVPYIHDSEGRRITGIHSAELIRFFEYTGKWVVQRYALQEMTGKDMVLGVSHFRRLDRIGTYIFGNEI